MHSPFTPYDYSIDLSPPPSWVKKGLAGEADYIARPEDAPDTMTGEPTRSPPQWYHPCCTSQALGKDRHTR
jgi:hypothetical protein